MLTYLLGDVLRIFAGDFTAGEMSGRVATQGTWLAAAFLMLIPIVMIVLTLTLEYPVIRWVCIIAAAVSLGPTTGGSDREARQRDRVQYPGLDVIWPMPGQAEARAIYHLELRWVGEGSSS